MKITFLGTGTSTGVPHLLCNCEVCTSNDDRDRRLRSSVFVEIGETKLLIDCGPDFRQQMLKYKMPSPDAILITHGHKDHISGLDENRQIQAITGKPTTIYADEKTTKAIKHDFFYAFADIKYPGSPSFDMHLIKPYESFSVDKVNIKPIKVMHYMLPILGFRIGKFAYITDASQIDERSIEELKKLDVLVINCLGFKHHFAHFNLEEALNAAEQIKSKHTYFTHLGHNIGLHCQTGRQLPNNVFLSYDGLVLEIED